MAMATSLWIFAAGIATGAVGALLTGRVLETVLVGVTLTDPATFLSVIAVFVLIGVPAAIIPASRVF